MYCKCTALSVCCGIILSNFVKSLYALQGQLLASSQAKVVELHTALTQQAYKAGVTDEQLLVDNARMSSQLESSRQNCRECEG